MLLSMTGFGDARAQNEQLSVHVEVKTVNNRYLKISTRCPDAYAGFETRVEGTVRSALARGTVTVNVRIISMAGEGRPRLEHGTLKSYWEEVQSLSQELNVVGLTDFGPLLALPGVLAEGVSRPADCEHVWSFVRPVLEAALDKLNAYRAEEGRTMQEDLQQSGLFMREQLDRIAERAPEVVLSLRDRLQERVQELLQRFDVQVEASDLIREVSILAERCDINEELTRLRCHLDQFAAFLAEETSQGRKLDFLSQEMFREINTIGSKANDVAIAHAVVDMKAANERIREIVQNVE